MDIGGKHLLRPHGILAGKAGSAETAFCVLGQLHHMLGGQVAQGIGPDDLIDLLHIAARGHQQLLVGDVGAEVAGIFERGGRDPEVDFLCTGIPQQLDDAVVPRTMESSTSTTRLPLTVLDTTFSLMRTLFSRCFWLPWIKVRPMYLFLMKPMP